jgi:hypothetical protein
MKERDDHGPFEIGSGHPATVLSTAKGPRPWLILLVLIVTALAAGGGYLYFFERELAERWLDTTPLQIAPTVTQVYKWRDRSGNWHITDEAPPAGVEYELLKYRSDENVLPLVPKEAME